ncbi:hypothetical protein ACS3UN_10220 [Oscillospiraceae bacterium LTW-04]|nr:hypothetical protein RBH76_11970 [Oscillospiraceae bacterium MB24-C1]
MPKKRLDSDATPVRRPGAKKETATAAEVLRELTDIGLGRRAFTATDRQGNTVENTASVPERIRALELLAKYHKLTGTAVELPTEPVKIVDDIAERPASSSGGETGAGGDAAGSGGGGKTNG